MAIQGESKYETAESERKPETCGIFADDIPNGCVGSKVKIGQANLNYHHAFSFSDFGQILFQGDIKEAKYLVAAHSV